MKVITICVKLFISLCFEPFLLVSVTTHISGGADSEFIAPLIDLGGGHIPWSLRLSSLVFDEYAAKDLDKVCS